MKQRQYAPVTDFAVITAALLNCRGPPLPAAKFELGDWRFVHAAEDAVVVSYRVKALSFTWQAYASSVWAKRQGKWVTVFYQASTAGG